MMKVARARHETINGRIKECKICSTPFRCSLELHGSVFRAIVNIEQLVIENESKPFQVEYYDRI